jgi:hypothetical protein
MPDISPTTAILIILAAAALIILVRRKTTHISQNPDAQRFARLLIADIKLYNEQEAESARKAGNIYQQLKPEIDRARKMYDERASKDEFNPRDYFHEELVKYLAGGDETKLGPGYVKGEPWPKPTVH